LLFWRMYLPVLSFSSFITFNFSLPCFCSIGNGLLLHAERYARLAPGVDAYKIFIDFFSFRPELPRHLAG
jgi:hypothetical protein